MLLPLIMLVGCTPNENPSSSGTSEKTEDTTMVLKVDNTVLDIAWEDNDSVKALNELARPELIINAHQYGDFEQVGPIGQTIVSNDTNVKTVPGDVVLYQSRNICLYYGYNEWSFTRLGHINLSTAELENILRKDNVTITLIGG